MTAIIEKMADDLARDAIEAADAMGDEELVMDLGKMLASSSTTAEEAYLTAAVTKQANDLTSHACAKHRAPRRTNGLPQ
jgi:hypothetical protein